VAPVSAGVGAVDHVVTLGTPHLGTPAATIARDVGSAGTARRRRGSAGSAAVPSTPTGASVGQMAEGSAYLSALASRPLAGRSVVHVHRRQRRRGRPGPRRPPWPAPSTPWWRSATPRRTGRLTSAPTAMREVGLALAGAGPTCVGPRRSCWRWGTATAVVGVERALGEAVGPVVGAADDVTGASRGRGAR
jgi:hypothetical protein